MEIKESGLWYKFSVPIPFEKNESEEKFLQKTKDCLDAFLEENSDLPKSQIPLNQSFYGQSDLSKLKGEISAWNFRDFNLKSMPNCDVDFYVGTPQDNYGVIGIDILTNANKLERKPMIDFLRTRWSEFDYKF